MGIEDVAAEVVDAVFKVHTALGPGLLESAYETCLIHELQKRGLRCVRQVAMPLEYDGACIDTGFRLDVVVEDAIVLELKAVEQVLPIHQAQLLTYLKLSGHPIGFLVNFNVKHMRDGIRRMVLNNPTDPLRAPSRPSR